MELSEITPTACLANYFSDNASYFIQFIFVKLHLQREQRSTLATTLAHMLGNNTIKAR